MVLPFFQFLLKKLKKLANFFILFYYRLKVKSNFLSSGPE